MTIEEHIKFWIESADEDLDSALAIFETKRYVWSLYIGHLSLEKILKALIIRVTDNSLPPKIHNLLKLSELAKISLDENQKEFFNDVNRFHIEGRYPEFKDALNKIATFEFTKENLQKIKENFQWLKSLIK